MSDDQRREETYPKVKPQQVQHPCLQSTRFLSTALYFKMAPLTADPETSTNRSGKHASTRNDAGSKRLPRGIQWAPRGSEDPSCSQPQRRPKENLLFSPPRCSARRAHCDHVSHRTGHVRSSRHASFRCRFLRRLLFVLAPSVRFASLGHGPVPRACVRLCASAHARIRESFSF